MFSPTDHKVKALIYWSSGSGKTVFWGTAPKPIFASAESGLLSLWQKEVPFVEINSIKDLEELLEFLQKGDHDFETVVIDSITEVNDIIKQEIEKKTGKPMQLNDWWTLSKKIKDLLRAFRDLPMHTLLISQETIERDGDTITKILPSLNGKSSTEIASFMDVVWYLYIDKTGERKIITSSDPRFITKDRSNKIGNVADIDFSAWVEKVKAIEIWEQKIVHDDATGRHETQQDDKTTTTAYIVSTTTDKTPVETETQPIQGDPVVFARLPVNKVKQVQIKWKEFAGKNGWNTTDSEIKRKATMKKHYGVISANDLTTDLADDFCRRIDQAIQK